MITNFEIFENDEFIFETLNDMIDSYTLSRLRSSIVITKSFNEIKNFIIKHKDMLNKCDEIGRNVLMVTLDKNDSTYDIDYIYDICVLLLKYGSKKYINKTDNFNNNAIIFASFQGNIQTVKLLIENGADWTQKDDEGKYFIFYLTKLEQEEIIKEYPNEYKELERNIKSNEFNL